MLEERHQGRWSDTRDPRCLAEVGRPVGRKLLSDLIGKTADGAIVDRCRQFQSLVTPEGSDVRPLPGEVALIERVDGELLGDLRCNARQLRP